jgi:hypothetical protein
MMGGLMITPFYPVMASKKDIEYHITGLILCSFAFGGKYYIILYFFKNN